VVNFNIANQQAGVVNNVGGDQIIQRGQYGQAGLSPQDLRKLVQDLRLEIGRLQIPGGLAAEALAAVDDLGSQLGGPAPDRASVASRLERLTRILSSAGALVGTGNILVGPLTAVASWLGQLGQPILRSLGG
jgi:hypothetical protein